MQSPVLELQKLADVPVPDSAVQELGPAAMERAHRFASTKAREEFIAGRVALHRFAASLLGVSPNRLNPDYHCPQCGQGKDHGRPGFMLDGVPAPLALSASKAQGWVLLAGVVHLTLGLRLGVDLEATDQAAFVGFDDVALTEGEKHFLASIPDNQRAGQRAQLWARKEARLKMTGEGLRRNPAEVDVLECPGLRDLNSSDDAGIDLPEGFVAALAVG
ncbi:4'-phosphopantetheinyl transferase family protein [Paenarthrobacter sp. 2TAF44]|uniref:4'-phosphopantetheinyl transferase family protein n=1 Tax=Paenarthrobacter sp. 2TAF44 TaxID=3233018 RepID=UPI003F94E87C